MTIPGTFLCPTGRPNCCPSCPTTITGQRQSGLPFNFTQKLGEGGFATVFSGKWDNKEAAFKTIPIKKDGTEYTTDSNGPWEMLMQVRFQFFPRLQVKLILKQKMQTSRDYPNLIDKPEGHFFIELDNQLYFCLVMKKYKSNLHQMNKTGLLSEEDKKTVVGRVADFVRGMFIRPDGETYCHGDIKDS